MVMVSLSDGVGNVVSALLVSAAIFKVYGFPAIAKSGEDGLCQREWCAVVQRGSAGLSGQDTGHLELKWFFVSSRDSLNTI